MKQEYDLTPADFERFPAWVSVHHYDSDESWYDSADEDAVRPWTGALPFAESRGYVVAAATFTLADGSVHARFCHSIPDDWDAPFQVAPARDGAPAKMATWSGWHGGYKESVLAKQSPVLFAGTTQLDFQLRIPKLRAAQARDFYAALGKTPREVFPLRFEIRPGLARGVVAGELAGFFDFPLHGTAFEIDDGAAWLAAPPPAAESPPPPAPPSRPVDPEAKPGRELRPADFERHPIWIPVIMPGESLTAPAAFAPWRGATPIDPAAEGRGARIRARFRLRDGSEFPGYFSPLREDWRDVSPERYFIGEREHLAPTPRSRWGDAPHAIVASHLPVIHVGEERFPFWLPLGFAGKKKKAFYEALGKTKKNVFPIRFEAEPGLANGIVAGELTGFCDGDVLHGHPPKLVA
jgi:hypothetical protein